MLYFGTTTPGGTAAQLWKISATNAPNIDLDAANGAAGIVAAPATVPELSLVLTDSLPIAPGIKIAGFATLGGATVDVQNFIIDNGSGYEINAGVLSNIDSAQSERALSIAGQSSTVVDSTGDNETNDQQTAFARELSAQDNATGENTVLQILPLGFEVASFDGLGNVQSRLNIDKDNIGGLRSNAGGYSGASFLSNQNGFGIAYHNAATNAMEYDFAIYSDKLQVTAPGTANPVFILMNDGKIRTNQTAATGAARAKVAEFPIYDTAGVLVCFVDVNL